MTHHLEPFTPDEFKKLTGLNASDNEAIYLRWVNTQINYATYLSMQEILKNNNRLVKAKCACRRKKISFYKIAYYHLIMSQ
jgi:hypothetical protein